jgi:hypothetical protein
VHIEQIGPHFLHMAHLAHHAQVAIRMQVGIQQAIAQRRLVRGRQVCLGCAERGLVQHRKGRVLWLFVEPQKAANPCRRDGRAQCAGWQPPTAGKAIECIAPRAHINDGRCDWQTGKQGGSGHDENAANYHRDKHVNGRCDGGTNAEVAEIAPRQALDQQA